MAKVTLTQGTTVRDGAGQALGNITCSTPVTTAPVPPDKKAIVIYEFGPQNATFSPAATITMTYDVTKIPAGVAETSLTLVYYDTTAGLWVELTDINVNTVTKVITGKTTHFTQFAVMCTNLVLPQVTPSPSPSPSPVVTPSPSATPTPAASQTPTVAPVTPSPTATATPTPLPASTTAVPWNIIIIIAIGVLVVGTVLWIVIRRRRSY